MFTVKRYVKQTRQLTYYGNYCNASIRWNEWGKDSKGAIAYGHSHCRNDAVLVVTQEGCRDIAYCELHGKAEVVRLIDEMMEEEGKSEDETVENNGGA